jgi:predicted transcriptional regulator
MEVLAQGACQNELQLSGRAQTVRELQILARAFDRSRFMWIGHALVYQFVADSREL